MPQIVFYVFSFPYFSAIFFSSGPFCGGHIFIHSSIKIYIRSASIEPTSLV